MFKFNLKICQIIGLSKDEFTDLQKQLKSLRNSDQRSTTFVLAVFLFWLKTGIYLLIQL
jgi:hypothetical protein